MKEVNILLAEDNKTEQLLVKRFIEKYKLPYNLTVVDSVDEAEKIIHQDGLDLILSDFYLTDGTAIDILDMDPDIPVIVITSSEDYETAILAMKAGAFDYIVKTGKISHLDILPVTIEKALKRKSDKRRLNLLSKAIMSINESIYFTDTNNIITYVNYTLLKTYGYEERELIGKNASILLKDNDPDSCLLSGETWNVKKDGTIFPVYMLSTPLLDKAGNTTAVCVIVADITRRKKAEEELKQYSEHLETLVKERTDRLRDVERLATIGETAAMVGHDLRNPLQVLVNNIYIAKLKLKKLDCDNPSSVKLTSDSLQNSLDIIEEQTLYMNKIVSDLQDLAKNMQPDKRDMNVKALINNLLSTTKRNSVKVSLNFDKNFPHLSMDESLMQRVFINLIINAIQSIADTGEVNIHGSRVNGHAQITITDTGSGIAPDALDKLFQPLFTTKSKGVGLGLSVCKRIVEAHDGTIKIENKPDNDGAIVTLTFPISKEN
jgi:PAS domain S-box-containing protein